MLPSVMATCIGNDVNQLAAITLQCSKINASESARGHKHASRQPARRIRTTPDSGHSGRRSGHAPYGKWKSCGLMRYRDLQLAA
jgi:hypothetical protein